jgi:hypothetical protein
MLEILKIDVDDALISKTPNVIADHFSVTNNAHNPSQQRRKSTTADPPSINLATLTHVNHILSASVSGRPGVIDARNLGHDAKN